MVDIISRKIPTEYDELQYIQSDGVAYINTGWTPTIANLSKAEFSICLASTTSGRNQAIGSNYNINMIASENLLKFRACGIEIADFDTDWHDVSLTLTSTSRVVNFDGTQYTGTVASQNDNVFYLFSMKSSSGQLYGKNKLKYVKLYDNNTLVRNFIPARRKSDSVLGMFDTVSQTFFTNANSSGSFTAGPTIVTIDALTIPKLPSGYQELSYIESTGTQYIDTGLGTHTGIFRLVATVYGNTASGYSKFLGYSSAAAGLPLGIWTHDNTVKSFFESSTGVFIGNTNEWVNIDITRSGSATIRNFYVFEVEPNITSYPISTGKVQTVKLYKDNDLLLNLVPARRISDGAVGMFDLVTYTFYGNSGTGTFVAGTNSNKDVKELAISPITPGYTQLEYIQSSGTQWIDTGFKPNQNTKVVATFNAPVVSGNSSAVFGSRVSSQGNAYDFLTVGNGFDTFDSTAYKSGFNILADTTYTVTKDGSVTTVSNGETYTHTGYTDFTSDYNMYLCATNVSGTATYAGNLKMYNCKVWENGSTLVRNFIPAKRISDDVIGMLDLSVHNLFDITLTDNQLAGYIQNVSVGSATQFKPYEGGDKVIRIPVKSNTTYTVRRNVNISTVYDRIRVATWNGTGSAETTGALKMILNQMDTTTETATFTTLSDTQWVYINVRNSGTVGTDWQTYLNDFIVVEGTTVSNKQFYTNAGTGTFTAGSEQLYSETIWTKYVPVLPATTTFSTADSKTGNAVTLTGVAVNNTSETFTQSGSSVTIDTPDTDVFTMKLSASGYNDSEATYTYATLSNATVNMTETQQTGTMEIAITWDHDSSETSRDIDTYAYVYSDYARTSEAFSHVYYGNKTASDSNTSVTLDKDDTGSSTGETLTIVPVYPDYFYHIYLQNFTQKSQTDPTGFADWNCRVKVTYNNVVVQDITTPAGSKGVYWDIMTIYNGNITMVNTYSNTITP